MWKMTSFFWHEKCLFLWVSPMLLINKTQKHWYIIYTWSDKAFMGTVVNRALPSFQRGSLEITLTVPYNTLLSKLYYKQRFSFLGWEKYKICSSATEKVKLLKVRIYNYSECKKYSCNIKKKVITNIYKKYK